MARPLGLPAIAAVAFFVACALFISARPQTPPPRDWPDQQQGVAATATAISPNLDNETGRWRSRPVAELPALPTPPACTPPLLRLALPFLCPRRSRSRPSATGGGTRPTSRAPAVGSTSGTAQPTPSRISGESPVGVTGQFPETDVLAISWRGWRGWRGRRDGLGSPPSQ